MARKIHDVAQKQYWKCYSEKSIVGVTVMLKNWNGNDKPADKKIGQVYKLRHKTNQNVIGAK